ncbi:MAG: hypothetical protein HDR92_09915 [Bacteroides sp.]|nr:hypothetical protein [Bacteroides sp.]
MDSAVHFAKNLSDNPEFNLNKFAGHRILAKNSLRSRNIDTIAAYHDSLAQFSVKMLDQHALGLNLPGTMFYRLMTTELDNSRLQTRNDTLALSVYALALLAAACIIIILVALYRRTYQRQKEDETIAHLQQVVLTRPVVPGEETYDLPKVTTTRESLVANLLQRMEHLARQPYQIPSELANASVVGTIRGMIADKQRLDSSSRIWTELEKAVCHASPNFKSDIYLLLNNSSTNDYHISLLIKAGFTPTEIALLLNRAKGTVSSNRQRMCERIFKQKLSNTLFDSLIRTL